MRRNDQIRAREVRLIGPEGEQLGLIARNEAIAMAMEKGMDLVEVAAAADPPVCRIMDYGKFKYEQQKKKHEAKKRQVVVNIKEIKMRPKTDEHDFETKIKHIRRFLEDGDRCKVTLFFRGREIVHKDRGSAMLDRVVEETKDIAKVEQEARAEGRALQLLLAPIAKKQVSEKGLVKDQDKSAADSVERQVFEDEPVETTVLAGALSGSAQPEQVDAEQPEAEIEEGKAEE